jgi:hypothetical protein
MGWGSFAFGGMVRVLGVLFVLGGVGIGFYEFLKGNTVTALIAFVGLVILGLFLISWGGYSRKQNTPIGREDVHSS